MSPSRGSSSAAQHQQRQQPSPVSVTVFLPGCQRPCHGIRCSVLLDERQELAQRCEARGTPIGYLIDEEGRIASPRA